MNKIQILILIFFAFLPPIIYAIWIRNTERYHRERWLPISICFLWGATIAIIASLFLEIFLQDYLYISMEIVGSYQGLLILLVAPFAEELTKPLALRLKIVKRELTELEDGLIYGAVAGLGFSATENLLYGLEFLSKGLFIFLILMFLRSIGGCLLHASATSLTGYGYGKTILKKTSFLRVFPYFLVAIFIHAFYNFLVSTNIFEGISEVFGVTIGLFSALILVYIVIKYVRNKIVKLDSINRS